MKKIFCILLLIPSIIACNNIKKQENNLSLYNQEGIREIDCGKMILEIVQSSNLDLSAYSDYFVRIERIEDNSIIIQVYFENDISETNDTKQIIESTIAWLSLDVNKKELYNITFDLENPITLSFNKELLNINDIKEICESRN